VRTGKKEKKKKEANDSTVRSNWPPSLAARLGLVALAVSESVGVSLGGGPVLAVASQAVLLADRVGQL
jgi:hypothetical protein